MAAKKKSRKPAVKKLTREEQLRQEIFVAICPACITMSWSIQQVMDKSNDMAHQYLLAEGVIKDE